MCCGVCAFLFVFCFVFLPGYSESCWSVAMYNDGYEDEEDVTSMTEISEASESEALG